MGHEAFAQHHQAGVIVGRQPQRLLKFIFGRGVVLAPHLPFPLLHGLDGWCDGAQPGGVVHEPLLIELVGAGFGPAGGGRLNRRLIAFGTHGVGGEQQFKGIGFAFGLTVEHVHQPHKTVGMIP